MIIEWRLSTFNHPDYGEQPIVVRSIFGPVAELAIARDNNGGMAQHAVCGVDGLGRYFIPTAATAWRMVGGPWQGLEQLPEKWRLEKRAPAGS